NGSAKTCRWETLSLGPFLLDGIVSTSSSKGPEVRLSALLQLHQDSWKEIRACFCGWTLLRSALCRQVISDAGFAAWAWPSGQSLFAATHRKRNRRHFRDTALQRPDEHHGVAGNILAQFGLQP